MLIGFIGDLHLRDRMPYSHLCDRTEEKEKVLDTIVTYMSDCGHVVFLGDQLHCKDNSSETIREFVAFVERFAGKKISIIRGNHEASGFGRSAVDFLAEVKNPNWKVARNTVLEHDGVLLVPWLSTKEISSLYGDGAAIDDKTATGLLMAEAKKLSVSNPIMATHYAMSGFKFNGGETDALDEMVLPSNELESAFDIVFAGHIHHPSRLGSLVSAGSVFTSFVGEDMKFVWKYDTETKAVTCFRLPVRPIYKIVNGEGIDALPKNAIVKIEITDRNAISAGEKKDRFDGADVVINIRDERERRFSGPSVRDELTIENLLHIYADSKGLDYKRLRDGYEAVRG